ncbi:hypothetical protein PIB30_049026 [Stylosanthes scabra]|uniref:Uncharacterized protein n=1 Tax=Stylosanthes scabra TaxID=79078 RepID=A0ABU6SHG1_9FABA|nr:hypothetical protein [Stylosanthes scabra]
MNNQNNNNNYFSSMPIPLFLSTPSTELEISQEEFCLFHSIDRELYKVLVFNLSRDPRISMHVLAFWIWLERIGYRRLVQNLLRLPFAIVNQAANEAVTCLNIIKGIHSYINVDVPVTRRILADREFSLHILATYRNFAVQEVSQILAEVCFNALSDIRTIENLKVPSEFGSFYKRHTSDLGTMSLFGLGNRNQKTFRPKKSAPSGSKGAQLQKHIDATLGSGNLREAVKLPPGEDFNEWLAVNAVDFFNQVNILYGTLTEFCTASNCPTMTAGPKYEYRWADGVTIKKPIEVSAPKYAEYLMDWIESQLDDETIFPQKLGAPFPANFKEVVKTIFKRLFRVYAHIYHSHFQKIVSLKEEAHLNTCFKHFALFTWEFRLIEKAELAPLQDLVDSIIQ